MLPLYAQLVPFSPLISQEEGFLGVTKGSGAFKVYQIVLDMSIKMAVVLLQQDQLHINIPRSCFVVR